MRYAKISFAVLVFLLSFTVGMHAEEAKQGSPPPVSPETKQDISKQEPAAAQEEAKREGHDAAVKEKRFVATVGPDGVQHVEIVGGEYYFDPNYIVVKVNVPVEFAVKKAKGYIQHDIVVKAPEAGIDFKIELSDKEAKTVKFTPTKVGKYEMECDKRFLFFKSHKERGMDGFIEVVQ